MTGIVPKGGLGSWAGPVRWVLILGAFGVGALAFGGWTGAFFATLAAIFTHSGGGADPALVQAQQTIGTALTDHDRLEFRGETTTYEVPLDPGVPPINSLYPGTGGIETGDDRFDNAVCLIANSASWVPLLNCAVRLAFIEMQPTRYVTDAHAFSVRAETLGDHNDFLDRVERARQLAGHLAMLAGRPRTTLMAQRLDEADGPTERLVVFKALWHADRANALALARTLSEPHVRYFVATASTPPDRAVIRETAFDAALDGALRTRASLRWLGLETGVYDLDVLEVVDSSHPAAALQPALLQIWVESMPDADEAIELVGRFGQPEHVARIGVLLNGPRATAARRALNRLRERFPNLQGGNLAIVVAEEGQLGLVEAEGALSEGEREG